MNILSMLLVGAFAVGATPNNPASCRVQVGHETAAVYVRDCLLNSPATHPPCNEANPCSLIVGEVVRSCSLGGLDVKLCEKYKKLQERYPLQTAGQ